jgi:peptide deformylase
LNPKILRSDGERLTREHCLSLPGEEYEVRRAKSVTVRFMDGMTGMPWTKTFGDDDAVKVQHEIDHLDGILISDKGGN